MNGWNRAQSVLNFASAAALAAAIFAADAAFAQEAQWIWSPEHAKDAVPTGAAGYFRKAFTVRSPESAQVSITADDQFELYVNGRRAGSGSYNKRLTEIDITDKLSRGNNILAVKVSNRTGKTAGLVARVAVKERGGEWESLSTDDSWRVAHSPLPLWNTSLYNDRGWELARVLGPLGETAPWDRREDPVAQPATPVVAGEQTPATASVAEAPRSERFQIADEFEVLPVIQGKELGSLIAMTFNEFGHILASKEGGPLLLIYDTNRDKIPDKVRTYCDKVTSCHGILALNGDVIVTADGPDGLALYRLADKDRDGTLEDVRTLIKFKCEVAEHGPHGVVLGPDGLIYVMLGNHTQVEGEYDGASPHRDYYEGDLIQPRYEDPGGHALGVKAPGGAVIRTDAEGSGVQLIAGGLRNPYDLAFNREGELFVHDADMETDEGMSWLRPTRLFHVLPGGEYGWRSGWANWPDYFIDSLPAVLDTGRGSPTGLTVYNHFMYPIRYQGVVFSADWSQGQINAIRLKRSGASYTATSEVFLQGNPLNVTDLEVGPDGCLYFITGGRGTSGGVYRIVWKGKVPAEVSNLGTGLTAVIRQPQLQSSWSRQNIAALRKQLGATWDPSMTGVVRSAANTPEYRLQALDLMQLYGPVPTEELLVQLSKEPNELVRAKAAELMGMHSSLITQTRLIELLEDSDRMVRRKACEALSRADQAPPLDKLLKLLSSDDRFEAWSARRLLERMPLEQWREEVLTTKDHRFLIQGGLALMIAYPEKQNGLDLLQQISKVTASFVSDRNFNELLRVMQVALVRGDLKPDEVPGLRRQLSEEFPSGDALMNRELVRLLVYLQDDSLVDRYLTYLKSNVSDVDKLHLAMHLRFLESGWTPQQRMELLRFYEEAQTHKGGGSYARYVINATRDFCKTFSEEESRLVLANGAQWPNAALGALYKLPAQLDDETLTLLKQLDGKLKGQTGDSVQRLQVGIVAVLARSSDEQSMAYLRKIWDEDPERRKSASLGLAQQPGGENWSYLIRSLPILEPAAARQVFNQLMTVDQAPEESEPYRQVILLGLRMKEKGAAPAIELLTFWNGEELATDKSIDEQLAAWQKWFTTTYPDALPAELPVAPKNSKHTFEELVEYLGSEEAAKATSVRGSSVFVRAQCAKCHRFGDRGESIGPDLTSVNKRFTKKELLESIVYPSHVISSQYSSQTVVTTDGRTLTGMLAPGAAGETVVLQASGEKVTLLTAEIEQTKPSKVSSMPEGLLNVLTLEEIADLFAYMQSDGKTGLSRLPRPSTMK